MYIILHYQTGILEIKSQRGKHPTQKPDKLMEWILKYYSKKGRYCIRPYYGVEVVSV